MALRYVPESNCYAVLTGETFLGRVWRYRDRYEHSNGRTYRSWVWAASPADVSLRASFRNRSRKAAGEWLFLCANNGGILRTPLPASERR